MYPLPLSLRQSPSRFHSLVLGCAGPGGSASVARMCGYAFGSVTRIMAQARSTAAAIAAQHDFSQVSNPSSLFR
eukprot:m.73147 g.73147  ORF g.73147 m.73147 type:complete len:74 (+) comp50282_c0_seq2:40-261(+)